jgi:hypothetical protein
MIGSCKKKVAGEGSCKLSLAIKKSPGLPAGRAEIRARTRNRGFPVMGNFRLRATSFLIHRKWDAPFMAPVMVPPLE